MRALSLAAARSWVVAVQITVLTTAVAHSAAAQGTGTVRGRVTRADDGTPLGRVAVTVAGTGVAGVTGPDGTYRLERVPVGQQTLRFRWLGYRPQDVSVTVPAGGTATADAMLEPQPITLEEVVVTASRAPERVVEAPAAVSIAEIPEVRTAAVTGQLPRAIANVPGVDLAQSGMNDFNLNTRGFNSTLNRRVLVLQDGRDLSVAFLGSQEWNANPPLEEAGRVEFVRGPGSALYGANAFSGVLSINTPTARQVAGSRITLTGGELSSFKGDLRYAGVLSQGRVGYKASGGYSTSDTWSRSRTAFDGRDMAREYAPATGDAVPNATEVLPLNGQTVNATTGVAEGERDPVTSWYGNGRLDYYATNGAIGTIEGGATEVQNEIFVTGIGRVQVRRALRPWVQAMWADQRYNVMAYYSGRNSLKPQYSLLSGLPLEEKSAIYHVEGQYNHGFAQDKGRVVVGASFRQNHVNTEGTLMAPVNDNRDDNYYSGYGQVEYSIIPQLRAVGAARFDDGDLLKEAQFSPKGALVFSPDQHNSIRFSVNRAFQTPNYSEFYLQVPVAQPTTAPRQLEQGIETFFQTVNALLGPAVAGLNLPNTLPWNFDDSTKALAVGNAGLDVEKVTGWELGYKGDFAQKGYVTLDGYINELKGFVTDLLPNVNPNYPGYDLTQQGTIDIPENLTDLQTVVQGLQSGGLIPPQQAAVLLATIAQLQAGYTQLSTQAGPLLATLPNGSRALVVSYTNAGRVIERGIELGAGYYLTNELKLEGTYTFFDFDVKEQALGDKLLPNTAKHKGTVSLSYNGRQGVDVSVNARIVDSFDWAAGVFAGRIPASQIFDVNAGYQINNYVRLFAIGTNVFDQQRFSIYGGSVNGRRVLGGVTATF